MAERHPGTLHMMTFDKGECPRSMQLYGVDPATMREAVKIIIGEGLADHIDANFGCPKPAHLPTRVRSHVAGGRRVSATAQIID